MRRRRPALRVHAVAQHLLGHSPAGVRDVVAAACTVALHYDPLQIELSGRDADAVRGSLAAGDAAPQRARSGSCCGDERAQIPVCYGAEFGEDLEAVARNHGLTPEDVIALHSAPLYRVQMLGFAPGFAYLAGLDTRIATPRRFNPAHAGTCRERGDCGGNSPPYIPSICPAAGI